MRPFLFTVTLAGLLAVPLLSAERLFLFQADSPEATVLEAPGLRPAGTARVGRGAFAAFQAGESVYVVASDRVTVFDDALNRLGEISLGADTATAATLVPYDDSVLVAASGRLYRIDTTSGRIASMLTVGGEASALHVPRDEQRAYWMTAGSRQVRVIDLATNSVLPGAADLAAVPQIFASGFIGAGSEVFSTSPLLGGVSGSSAAPGKEPSLMAASPAGARLLRSGGALLHASADGSRVTSIADPATGEAFSSAIAQSALSDDGDTVFLALEDGRVLALDANDERPAATAWMASAPSALAVVANPQQSTTITKVSGDQQAVVSGANFTIVVSGPIGGLPMTVTSDSPAAQCDSVPALSGQTIIGCTANSVTTSTTAMLTVSAAGASVTFTIYVVPPGLPDGLFIISGDNQTVNAGASFSLVVEARLNGLPRQNAGLSVNENSAVLSCPAPGLTTNAAGRATITCNVAGTVQTSETATITVADPSNNTVQFTANIVGQTGSNDALVRVTPDPVIVPEGQPFNLTIQATVAGAPQANVPLSIAVGNSAVAQCPAAAITGVNGQATIACMAGEVTADTSFQITFTDGVRTVSYSVTVKDSSTVDGLQKFSGDAQTVPPSTQFPMPLVVRALSNGQPQANLLLGVTVNNNAAVTCAVSALTDSNGLASISCTSGAVSNPTQVTINVTDAGGRMLPSPFTATVTANAGGGAETLAVIAGASLSAKVGDSFTAAIQVRTIKLNGAIVPGASVYATAPQGITIGPAAVVQSDGNGIASFDVTFGCAAPIGQINLGLTSSTTEATIGYLLSPGPLNQLQKMQGDNQTGVPGQRLAQALLVKSVDQCGTILSGIGLTWAAIPVEAATLEAVVSTTNPQGQASALVRPTTRGGAYQVKATSVQNAAISATFMLTTQNTPAQLQIVSGNQQVVPVASQAAAPLVVRVAGAGDQPVAGVTVTFQVTSGTGAVGTASVVTDAQGRASTTFTSGTVRGPVTVRATAAGLTANFTLTVGGGPPQLQLPGLVNGASFQSGFVAGSTGTIFGVNITDGISGAVSAPYDPANGFPTLFLGVRVTVGGIAAPILSLANVNGQEQINIQVPFGLAQGTVAVTVEVNGVGTTIQGVPIFGAQPGIFEYALGGQLYAAVLHADYQVVTPQNPARPGEVLLAFVTGLGRITPAVPTNQAGPVSPLSTTISAPTVTLNGVAQAVEGSFYAPQLMTVYQINFRVGATTPPGSLTIVVSTEGSPSKSSLLPVGPAF